MSVHITQKTKTSSSVFKKGCVRLTVCAAFLLALALTSTLSYAKEDLTEKYSEQLKQVENYLNNIKNLSAEFTQESPEAPKAKGKFLLSRFQNESGNMRIEYISGPQVVIIVKGVNLTYYDKELDETSQMSTNTTPASLLTRPNISFSAKDVELTNVDESNNEIKISLMKKNRKEAGKFSLIFKKNPLQFVRMEIEDDLEQVVRVTLSDMNFSKKISQKNFE